MAMAVLHRIPVMQGDIPQKAIKRLQEATARMI
jgi:hypothetical protein